jgi:hypothetical protein
MKVGKYWVLAVMGVYCALVLVCIGKEGAEKEKSTGYLTKVQLDITGTEEIKNDVYRYISKGLERPGDVRVVKEDGDWVINIVASKDKDAAGRHVGFTFSIVVLERFRLRDHDRETIFKAGISEDDYATLDILTSELYSFRDHGVEGGGPEDLQPLCESIVKTFDASHLQKARQWHDKIEEAFEEAQEE